MHKLFHKHLVMKPWKPLDSTAAQVLGAASLELSHSPQSFVATCIGIFTAEMRGRVMTSCAGVIKVPCIRWENPINEWLLLKPTSLVAAAFCQGKHLGTKLAAAHLVNNLIEINCQKFAARIGSREHRFWFCRGGLCWRICVHRFYCSNGRGGRRERGCKDRSLQRAKPHRNVESTWRPLSLKDIFFGEMVLKVMNKSILQGRDLFPQKALLFCPYYQ